MKVAIIHDWLVTMRGGEKVLEALCELYPSADLYTIYCKKENLSEPIKRMNIKASFIQDLPFAGRNFRWYLPLFPLAIESFKLDGYDLVLSTSHCVAKGIVPPPGCLHICYCHSPMRYAWDFADEYFGKSSNLFRRALVNPILTYLKRWDIASCPRVHRFIANSANIAYKIKKYYNREAFVVYPPVDTGFFDVGQPAGGGEYYLVVSSLVPYKKVDIAVDVFNKIGQQLKIAGDGPLYSSLKGTAKPNVQFLKMVDQQTLRKLYQGCKALIFTQEEDLGIAALEAQACGKPVVAYAKGGALETVIDGKTGIFFDEQTSRSLAGALERFECMSFDPQTVRESALRFNNRSQFKENMLNGIKNGLEKIVGRNEAIA